MNQTNKIIRNLCINKKTAGTKTGRAAAFLAATIILAVLLSCLVSCSGAVFVPGASFGYFIWEDASSNIHVAWSVDRKDTSFTGRITTDGAIENYELVGFEDNDRFEINKSKNSMDFEATLSKDDFSDELVFKDDNYSYIEFELKINNAYDLSRINLGAFLNNPEQGVFRIDRGYFDKISSMPIYTKHPLSGFLYKLARDMRFTVFYLFIFGAIAIEVIRITALRKNKKYNWYLFLCYGVLALLIFIVYIALKRIT
ncbi:MAG: hypothetical protein BWY60_00821 [Actinobacteria bacterium ADurb.Bin346]|nr:MAG: hypothetical protein BWY60_00821 [Actinobacteria bacterium ADurb.Bin346]